MPLTYFNTSLQVLLEAFQNQKSVNALNTQNKLKTQHIKVSSNIYFLQKYNS